MSINKREILKNICYTELVYGRINKKLNVRFSKKQIGKNFYISNAENNIKITINSNTFRVITVDMIR